MEAKKTKGRMIKKHDHLSKVVKIVDFSFEEIAKMKATWTDNTHGNVIFHRLHDENSIDAGVNSADHIIKSLDELDRAPILKPIDFTDDWTRMKNRFATRRDRVDDEDEIEIEMEMIMQKNISEASSLVAKVIGEDAREKKVDLKIEATKADASKAATAGPPLDPAQRAVEVENQHSNFRIQKSTPESFKEIEKELPLATTEDPHGGLEKISKNNTLSSPDFMESEETTEKVSEKELGETVSQAPREHGGAEFRSFSSYLDPSIPRQLNAEETDFVEKAKSQGYEDGYKLGEEKATFQAKRNIESLTKALGGALNEVQELKKNVLLNAQENFNILAQSLIENLLRREFVQSPESLAALFQRAVEDVVQDDDFKVYVSPSAAEGLKRVVDDKLKNHILGDTAIEDGNFRVVSKLTVVDAKISEVVADMLQRTDLSLFKIRSKAS